MELKIKNLVLAKHFLLKNITESAYLDENDFAEKLEDWLQNFMFLAESLNIPISHVSDILSDDHHFDKLISSYINSSQNNNSIHEKIFENYGKEISEYYKLITEILTVNYIASFFLHKPKFNLKDDRDKVINSEYKKGAQFLKDFLKKPTEIDFLKMKYFSFESLELYISLFKYKNSKRINYVSLYEISLEIVNILFPGYDEVDYNLKISSDLFAKLDSCKCGVKDWCLYEQTCVEILRFVFIPEFNLLYFQKRTENGHQVRDVILPNTKQKGFWGSLKHEFNSKNIVIEMKNGIAKNINKDSINQLRIYLSKKTIGRFGLLFIRNKPSKSLLIARKMAYEESGILILIVDDKLLKKLILGRVWFGSCKDILQKEKIKFEIDY